MRVLLIEDEFLNADLLEYVLTNEGRTVTSIAGVIRRSSTDELVGISVANGEEIELDLSQFDVAAVDGKVIGDIPEGWNIVPFLVAAGIKVIGISSSPESNQKIRSAGAIHTMDKLEAMGHLPDYLDSLK